MNVQFVLVVYVCLLFEDFSLPVVVVGILCHLCYASLLSTFPVISLLSPGFIGGTCTFNYGVNVTGGRAGSLGMTTPSLLHVGLGKGSGILTRKCFCTVSMCSKMVLFSA